MSFTYKQILFLEQTENSVSVRRKLVCILQVNNRCLIWE